MRTDKTFEIQDRISRYEHALRELAKTKLTKAQQKLIDEAGVVPGIKRTYGAEKPKSLEPLEIVDEFATIGDVLDESLEDGS